jgi:3',5'-cyclic AMP phosphodiesterase CpdA
MKRFVIAADPHGDQQDETTRRALFAFIKDFKPEIRIHAGDAWDFRNLRKGASDDEKAHSLEDDWTAGSEWLREFFDGGKQNHFLRGNHDERLWRFAESSTGLIRDYAHDGIKRVESIVKKARANMLPYDARLGVLRLGNLKTVHGYFSGVGAARRHGFTYGNCLFGHVHSTDSSPVESIDGPAEARGIGCCCKIDMSYNQHMPAKLRHVNAWCYGMLFPDDTYQLFQAKKINGSFYAAQSIKEF